MQSLSRGKGICANPSIGDGVQNGNCVNKESTSALANGYNNVASSFEDLDYCENEENSYNCGDDTIFDFEESSYHKIVATFEFDFMGSCHYYFKVADYHGQAVHFSDNSPNLVDFSIEYQLVRDDGVMMYETTKSFADDEVLYI